MPKHLFAVFVAAVLLTAGGCSTITSPSTGQSVTDLSSQLEGTWMVTAIQPAGAGRQDRPSGATYTVSFSGGRLSARVDCNSCGGAYSVSHMTLTAGPALACTRAACPTLGFESAYTAILSGDSEVVMTPSTLTLSSSRGTIWLTRQG